jgi:ABC-type polysaccharide/polyol phosphate export permease
MNVEIYDSAHRPHPLVDEFMALLRYRELIVQFVSRNIKTRYKRSVLGVVWTMLNPLLTMIVLSIVFSRLSRTPNYPVYILCGLVAWNFFSSTTRESMGDMVWSGSLLNRIYVPKSVFVVSAAGTGLINLALALIPLLLIALVFGVPLRPALLVLPLSVLVLAVFALGLGMLLATAAVYFADMLPVYDVVLQIWLYASPIIFPVELFETSWAWLFRLNPLFYMIRLFRAPLYEGVVPPWPVWAISGGIALVTFIAGGLIFTAKSHEYAYHL